MQPHGLQHARFPCPSLSPRVSSDSCPLSRWFYLNILSSVTPFSFCLQSFQESVSFPVSQLFASGVQSIWASFLASVLPMNTHGWSPVGLTVKRVYLLRNWCWSWNSNTLASWCEELTHLKRPWYWERLRAGVKGDDRGWVSWMSSLTQWTWVWVNSRSLWLDREAWCAVVLGAAKSWTWLSNWTELN